MGRGGQLSFDTFLSELLCCCCFFARAYCDYAKGHGLLNSGILWGYLNG